MASYVVGIDLGTTHTVVASARVDGGSVVDDDVVQLVAPGETAALPHLPSALYVPLADELNTNARALPWGAPSADAAVVGAFARRHGARAPGRLVTSAKSWLSVGGVDKRAPILPWGAAKDVARLSPLDAQAAILQHLRAAWDHAHADAPLAQQDVTVTIPASFDEVARELTLEAASRAGLPHAQLLEEPQAAFYAFLSARERDLATALAGVRVVLVVDVGGGTTDLTLIAVEPQPQGPPRLSRIAVGDHLMLGGDNMDIALARFVEKDVAGGVGQLDALSFAALVESARGVKETLLSARAPEELLVSIPGKGSKLVGGARSAPIKRSDVEALLVDGFMPFVDVKDATTKRTRTALTELGLPYEREPAITRHIAAFLQRFADAAADAGARMVHGVPMPDALLLNGGVFQAAAMRARLRAVFQQWNGDAVRVLGAGDDDDAALTASLDRGVARGAAYAGLVKRGRGLRIGGGSSRAYFVGIGDKDGASRALCVVPRGMLEGDRIEVQQTFRLVVDRPVGFPLYASTTSHAQAGDVVTVDDSFDALPPLETVMASEPDIPVRVQSTLTEVGTLELALHVTDEALRRFRLAFSTRTEGTVPAGDAAKPGQVPRADQLPKQMEEGRAQVLAFFGNKSKDVDPKRVKDLRRDLEKVFGPREQWSTGLCRELGGALLGGAARRRRTVEHERAFFQLLGFCLRPGTGAPFDDWRMEQLWPLWKEGVQHVSEKPTWASWWIMWRRVAGGLRAEQQREMFGYLKPWLLEQGTGKKGSGPTPHGADEMVRLAAVLERVTADDKAELGAFVLKKIGRGGITSYWALGRLGARVLTQGSAHDVVGADVVAGWIDKVLLAELSTAEGAAFALAQMCRVTGDRARDVDAALRERVAQRLEKAKAPAHLVTMVREKIEWTADDDAQSFGEALPPGLRLG